MDHNRFSGLTLVDTLRQHASEVPDALAYMFLTDGEDDQVSITYAEMDRRARSVAGYLESVTTQGERALLLYPQGIEYLVAFWGCLYAGIIPIPLYPPSPKQRSLARIQAIANDAKCKLALSTQQIISAKQPVFDQVAGLHGVALVATDTISPHVAECWRQPAITADTLAYLQYTSGSTAIPKGVMISHGNLLHNVAFMRRMYRAGAADVFVSWGPFFHDMGLTMGTLLPLYARFPCVLMSPASFAQRPARWLRAISRFRGTISFGSNFAFDLCVNKVTPEQRSGLDLSCWNVAINGSEPVRTATLERFAEAFGPHGFRPEAFYPSYGLAEATLVVSCGHTPSSTGAKTVCASRKALENGRVTIASPGSGGSQTLVGCGLTWPDGKAITVDPRTATEAAPGTIGEIWVSGGSVAQGYWNRAEETNETFRARLSGSAAGPFLRTGDLGFIRDGELYITGRLKDMIIIRGRNLYPQDIESTVEASHPGMRRGCGAAFAVDVDDEEKLVVVQEIERGQQANAPSIVGAARRAVVEEHEVQPYAIVLVKPGSIAKTSSGKIQRRACRDAFINGSLEEYNS